MQALFQVGRPHGKLSYLMVLNGHYAFLAVTVHSEEISEEGSVSHEVQAAELGGLVPLCDGSGVDLSEFDIPSP